jgi:hypothetical protein
MDNVVTLYHGGSVEEDEFWNVNFVGMQRLPLIFDDRPLFSELLGSARDELHCNSNEDDISVEGAFHVMCVLNYVMHYFVMFYLHYLRNIELIIMTTNNETNNTTKGSIIGHIKQHTNV